MKYGYIKVAVCSPELKQGATKSNLSKIKEAVKTADKKKAEIIIFGENAVTGGNVFGMSNYETVLNSAKAAIAEIAAYSKNVQSLIVAGFPVRIPSKTVSAAAVISAAE